MSEDPDARSSKLVTFFNSVIHGRRQVGNTSHAKRFFEAICDQEDHSRCVEKLVASPHALAAFKTGLRLNISAGFINNTVSPLLHYLSNPLLKQLCQGQFLQQLLSVIVDPPTLMNAFSALLDKHALNDSSTCALAWLINELLTLSTSQEFDLDVNALASKATENRVFLDSPSREARSLGHKIEKFLQLHSLNPKATAAVSAGGRHDNDFGDFRKIEILPTGDELMSQEQAFYRRADDIMEEPHANRPAAHLDNQFRLLREDMLGELRLDLQVALGQSKVRRPIMKLKELYLSGPQFDEDRKRKPFALKFRCSSGIPRLSTLDTPQKRGKYLSENRNFLKHQSVGCILYADQVVAFATLDRDDQLLAQNQPQIVLQVSGSKPLQKVLLSAKTYGYLDFVLVDTPIFAYAPILKRLQDKTDFSLADNILSYHPETGVQKSPLQLSKIKQRIEESDGQKLKSCLRLQKEVTLDPSQTRSLLSGLNYALSLIQGPPGTGKSFIGALIAKAILDNIGESILVICFTNHALDQFLEDLMDIGISKGDMVRLGAKSSSRTEDLNLFQQQVKGRLSRPQWQMVDQLRAKLDNLETALKNRITRFGNYRVNGSGILSHLEFSDDDGRFYDAFSIPEEDDGMNVVDERGKKIGKYYLFDRWRNGRDAGVLRERVDSLCPEVWEMNPPARKKLLGKWQLAILKESTESIGRLIGEYNASQSEMQEILKIRTNEILKCKRIIGCTTTAAAKYASEIQSAMPGVIIVEEAGEILESHIITAMSEHTKHLVLIGDHKQLRPKSNNYDISVEKGSGFNLNRSLFERLVLGGFPCETLNKQHRMPPEVSTFVRQLTYPDLEDADTTLKRPSLRGFQNRVIFANHEHPEMELEKVADRRDEGSRTSKRNEFEADMVLRCVRYLGQQGYGTDQIVVLTPYLGQLSLLRQQLSKENDPVLNDLDSFDLIRAGLITPASAAQLKRPLRISTIGNTLRPDSMPELKLIDNYQGEESDIVVGSLTRSNSTGDIGFMSAPERLNVLLSRARIGLILFGNATTFLKSKRGNDTWVPFIKLLKENGHLYDGLPIQCERHPSKTAILQRREDFDLYCPDGGCPDPCGTKLICGQHDCPQRCHQLYDHSKMQCNQFVDEVCPKSHNRRIHCWKKNNFPCRVCADEAQRQEKRRARDQELDNVREQKQRRHAQKMAEMQDEMDHERRLMRDGNEDAERANALRQREKDLLNFRKQVKENNILDARAVTGPTSTAEGTAPNPNSELKDQPCSAVLDEGNKYPIPNKQQPLDSPGKTEWEYRKAAQGDECDALDELMDMIGLEDVKEQFLSIKDKVDISVRQSVDLRFERFSALLLGNPGTGKTTVARLYARFLTSVGALPGDFVKETTGSRLASDGVRGCQAIVEEILNNGGGALFIDEAYQLASGQNPGGGSVLDFLLAEIENLRGKVVFILAGYNKQMEAFFAHNPGLPSRFPQKLQFQDYTDNELLRILQVQLEKRYKARMKVSEGATGLYARIVARRIGRGRNKEGFGNARAMENALSRILDRQSKRLRKGRRDGATPDDMLLTQEDLIGPEPSGVLSNSTAWMELQKMIGLASVKETIKGLLEGIEQNYCRELEEQPPLDFSFNRVFLGSPGTGKTSVAKLYGKVLADLGLLSCGEVVVKTPADFVGSVLGESEKNTKGILAASVGKVLVIDEAYGLCGTGAGNADPYKTAVIDTIVAEVQSIPGEDRCVLLLGYHDQMQAMFQAVNPGLSRRFPLDSAFEFEDFSDDELKQILQLKLLQQGLQTTEQGAKVAMEVLQRTRNRPNFGNAGEVDILLNGAKLRLQRRRAGHSSKRSSVLKPEDFDKDFDRSIRAATNIRMLFKDVVGCDGIVGQLEQYQRIVANMKARDMDPREQLPFNFLFRGPPGTGKTTTARKMGKVYYDMGFLSTAEVIECSATEIVGEYVGQTGPKTQKLLEKALGKVLFVDEAYRLADGHFAKEAMDEIVDCLTKPKFAQRLVVILAGYDDDINRLMSINPGLTSRFPETIVFESLSPDVCVELLTQILSKNKKALDIAILTNRAGNFQNRLLESFRTLSNIPNWANARDVQTIGKAIFSKAISAADSSNALIKLDEEMTLTQIDATINERSHRATGIGNSLNKIQRTITPQQRRPLQDLKSSHNTSIAAPPTTEIQPALEIKVEGPRVFEQDERDQGVSEAIWAALQRDKDAAEEREAEYRKLVEGEKKTSQDVKVAREHEMALALQAQSTADDDEKRRIEEQRIKNEMERRAKEAELAEIERMRKEAEEGRKKEAAAQKKLRAMGVCVAGFRWIRQVSGYSCAGGSHFISNGQLDKM